MKTINPFVCVAAIAVAGLSFNASAEEFRAPRLGVVCETPAQARPGVKKSCAWEQSLLAGNGAMGAMVPGELAHEEMFLSHARLFLPLVMKGRYFELGKNRDKARELALAGVKIAVDEKTKTIELKVKNGND